MKHNRYSRLIRLERLEARLAPALSMFGPYSPDDLALAHSSGADLWRATVNPGNELHAAVDAPAWVDWLAAAPKEGSDEPLLVAIPQPEGVFEFFRVWEVSVMAPELAAKFPDIRTYRGQGIDEPSAILAADVGPAGFHAEV